MAGLAESVGVGTAGVGLGEIGGVGLGTLSATTVGGLLTGGIAAGAAGLSVATMYGFAKRERMKIINHILKLFSDQSIVNSLGKMISKDINDPDYKYRGISVKSCKKLVRKWYKYMGGYKVNRKSYTLHYLMEIDSIERNTLIPMAQKIRQLYDLLSGGISQYLGWWNRALVDVGIISLPDIDRPTIKEYFKISKQMRSQYKKTQKIAKKGRDVIMD
tara:strand:+ start:7912 stop:8562 length:651 start_codon:yes stop_codon:yes gene_type:complete